MIIPQLLESLRHTLDTLYEMALPQAKVMDKVRDLSTPIFKHCIKIIMYGKEESQTLHHWCHELNSWLDQCVECQIKRKKNPYPTSNELLTWLTDYYKNVDDIKRIRRNIEREYVYQGHKNCTLTDEELYNSVILFLQIICPIVTEQRNTDDVIEFYIRKFI